MEFVGREGSSCWCLGCGELGKVVMWDLENKISKEGYVLHHLSPVSMVRSRLLCAGKRSADLKRFTHTDELMRSGALMIRGACMSGESEARSDRVVIDERGRDGACACAYD